MIKSWEAIAQPKIDISYAISLVKRYDLRQENILPFIKADIFLGLPASTNVTLYILLQI